MPIPTNLKLGRQRSPQDGRDLRAARYLQELPDPPAVVDWSSKISSFSIYKNDQLGDCTVAATAHQIVSWYYNNHGRKPRLTNPAIVGRYSEVSGYVPGDASTDRGANERDVLKLWLTKPLMGHALAAFAAVDVPDQSALTARRNFQTALNVFGGLYLGLDLPLSAQDQFANHQPWTVAGGYGSKAGSWGGHAVTALGYSDQGVQIVTWGRKHLMSWPFLSTYASEAWALISPDWLNSSKSPSGFDLAGLQADLAGLRA